MSRTIEIDLLDASSVDAAIREIQEYANWVQTKTDELRERVAELIRRNAHILFVRGGDELLESDSMFTWNDVEVRVESGGDNTTLVIADGKEAVFIEFGAGVYYNGPVGSSPNPLGAGLGFTIGSYGKGYGAKEVWGFYGEDGELHLTHGTPANMPLYNAVQSVSQDIVRIARGVFSDT